MGDLTNNLSRHEFACKCGCGLDTADIGTVSVVQDVCDNFGCSVIVTSGCRCTEHNEAVGGAKSSQHVKCRAADCVFKGVKPSWVFEYLCKTYPDKFGFGLYEDFVHIDTRSGGAARW